MAPTKRTVDANDESKDVSDPKRPRINLNPNKKADIISAILATAVKVYELYEIRGLAYNINVAHQVASILQGAHNILRKMANNRMATHPHLAMSATITIGGSTHSKPYSDVTKILKAEFATKGIEYTLSNRTDNNHWYGIANPIFNILSAFKLRFDEIRLGVGKMPINKTGDTTTHIDMAQYGITPAHHVLLEGSTYKPERRSAMAQTLGPLTSLILSYRSKDPYRNKWIEAVKRDVGHVPNSLNLANAIYGKRAEEIAPAVGAFSDCLLISGARNAQRAFFPLNMIMLACLGTKGSTSMDTDDQDVLVPIDKIDFSGKGMWLIYKAVMKKTFTMETNMDDITAGQMVYHAIFGTHNEDLGVLQTITNTKTAWKLRSDVASLFRSEGKVIKPIKLPQQVYYSKLAQANMTGLLTESSFQIASKQIFAGKRTANYIDAFYKHMESDGPSQFSGGMSLPALATYYRELKKDLLKKKDEHPVHGTVLWRKIDGLTIDNHGPEIALDVRETGRFFCGRSN